jgi:hypothetical protein
VLPVEILRETVESYAPYLRTSGERRWLDVPELNLSRTPQEELGHA